MSPKFPPDETENDPRYKAFVQQLVLYRTVYTLQDDEDYFAECPSEVYDDNLGEPEAVYCFWDNLEDTQSCQHDEWQDYEIVEIPLVDFMEDILIGMDEDAHLVGVAFDEELYGTEVEPVELLRDLLNEIRVQNQSHEYENYGKLRHYCDLWEQEIAAQNAPIIH